ncbi:hypothetical protein ACRV89_004662 [Salmonella enterica subsp. enterica serovar Newport]
MTECSLSKSPETVIIFGEYWPVVSAVRSVIQGSGLSGRCIQVHTIPELTAQLFSGNVTRMIFCLRPREHVFLFYALKRYLSCIPLLIICDDVFFTDRVMLQCIGVVPVMQHSELQVLITGSRGRRSVGKLPEGHILSHFLTTGYTEDKRCELPDIFDNPDDLMSYLQDIARDKRKKQGLTFFQERLLQEMSDGYQSLELLSQRLCCGQKKVSRERRLLPMKLGMSPGLSALLYGSLFCNTVQKTKFHFPLSEVEPPRESLAAVPIPLECG